MIRLGSGVLTLMFLVSGPVAAQTAGDAAAALAEIEADLPALRRGFRQDEALARLRAIDGKALPTERQEAWAGLVARTSAEEGLLGRAGKVAGLRSEEPRAVILRIAALDQDAAAELVLADLAFHLGLPAEAEDALSRAVGKDAGRKADVDALLAAARKEPVPRGGWFRYRGRWLPMERRDREQALDEALEKLWSVRAEGIGFPFEPSATEGNLDRFEKALGPKGEAFLRDGARRVRADLDGDDDEIRKLLQGYARQPSIRQNLLAQKEAMAKPRREALDLIGRYGKSEQPQVDQYRRTLEDLFAKYDELWEIERRSLAAPGPVKAGATLDRARAREDALAAIHRCLERSGSPGLETVAIRPAAGAETTPRHLLPGRGHSGLEDVLWVAAHFAAGRIYETLRRAEDLLRARHELTPWEVLVLEEIRADAIEAYNAQAATSHDAEERRFVSVLNRYRRVLGLKPFEVEERLSVSARRHSLEEVALGYFGHISPVARNRGPTDRARNEGYDGGVGENCLSGGVDGAGAFEGWYHSPGHHRNLVSGGPHLGIGATNDHGMWTMVAGGADLTWRGLHRDVPPEDRRRFEIQAAAFAEEAKQGPVSDKTRSATAALLPGVLLPLSRTGFTAANDPRSPLHSGAVPILREVAGADAPTDSRPLQIAAVAALIGLIETSPRPEIRQQALDAVRPFLDDVAAADPAATKGRHQAVAGLHRQWEDQGRMRFRTGGVAAHRPKPLLPGRVGDGPTLEAPLKVLSRQDRLRLSREHGGGAPSEAAVEKALTWLSRAQDPDGGWHARSFATTSAAFQGQEARLGAGQGEWEVAMTALSLLAFSAGGNTTVQGPHAKSVARGAQYLMERILDYGRIDTTGSHYLYSHALATQALCELYAYSADPRIGVHAQLATDYLVAAQEPRSGGWRYEPRDGADMSVTGWVVMALVAAQKAKLDVSGFRGAQRYVDALTSPGYYRVGYTSTADGGHDRLNSVGAVVRLYLDGDAKDPRVLTSAWRFLNNLPRSGGEDFYYWYYATIAMFQAGGEFWRAWSGALIPALVGSQVVDGSAFDGSWDPRGEHAGHGGRIYQTALGALMLTTWYRYDRALRPRVPGFTGRIEDRAGPYFEALRDAPDDTARGLAGRRLIERFGNAAAPAFVRLLQDRKAPAHDRRRHAVFLVECAGPEIEGALLGLLADEPDGEVRRRLVEALEDVASPRSAELLERHLVHEDPVVRIHAARALGRLGEISAAAALARRLQDEKDPGAKAGIETALRRLSAREAGTLLVDAALPKDAPGRLRVLRGLDLLEGGGFGQRVLDLREREPKLWVRAVAAVREHREAAAVPVLLAILESADQDTRAEANKLLVALARIDHGFDAAKPEDLRRQALARWLAWWNDHLREFGAGRGG